jgi:predicted lipid-binding transport protein (Tim44 family)
MEQPAEPRTRRAAGPKPESPSRPREPHSRTPVSGRDDERNRWLGGLVAGLLLALATLVVARLGRRRR